MTDEKKPKKGGILSVFKDIVYGMSSHEMTRHAVRSRKRRMLRERDITDVLG